MTQSNDDAVLPLQEFTQTRMADELEKIKNKSSKEFERLIKADLTKLSKGKNLKGIKNTFSILLKYLHKATASSKVADAKRLQQQIPVIEEAIEKLEQYHELSKSSDLGKVVGTKEFKEFKEFFDIKFPKEIEVEEEMHEVDEEEEKIGIWDVETVKKDYDYELFFIRRENGSHFFSQDLIKKLRFSIDFSHLEADKMAHDPILSYKEIQDEDLYILAGDLVDKNYRKIQWYLQAKWEEDDRYLYLLLRKAIMALLMASHTKNLLANTPVKMCSYYFYDFQYFLRDVMTNPQYLEFCEPSAEMTPIQTTITELVQGLCGSLYTHDLPNHEKYKVLDELVKRARIKQKKKPRKEGEIESLIHDFQDFNSELAGHAGGPLIKVWDYLHDADQLKAFDSILQENIPSTLFDVKFDGWVLSCLRIPSPTKQFYIQKVEIIEEFKNFLRAMLDKDKSYKHLLINLQNRTSLKGYSRSVALEQFQTSYEFTGSLIVVTLPRGTDFYRQKGEYDAFERIEDFMEAFKEQIQSGLDCGFFFPPRVQPALSESFLDRMLDKVHKVFFGGKKAIGFDGRKCFIELVYLLLQIKMIETVHPSSFSLTCKDAIDDGGSSNVLFYCFIELLNKKNLDEKSRQLIDRIVFDIPMMARERTINHVDFDRFSNCIKLIKQAVDNKKLTQLRELFDPEIFDMQVLNAIR